MKSLLAFSFYLTAIAFVSGIILNETSLLVRPKAFNIQNKSQKVFLLNPQARAESKIGNLIYLKHLMELKCLKKTIEDIRNKNQLGYHQSHKPLEVSLTQNLQNQISKAKKMRLNPSHVEAQNSRIIFLPYKVKFAEENLNKFLKIKKSQSIKSEVMSNDESDNFSEKKQKSKFIQPPPFISETENSRLLTKNEGNSNAVSFGSFIKNYYQPKKTNNVKSTPPTHPVASYPLQRIIPRIIPNEIKELFDQRSSSEFKNHQFDKQNYLGSVFLRRKQGRKSENLKLPGTNIDINNSKSKILGTLPKSVNSSNFSIKEIFNNSSSHNSRRGSDPSNLGMYSDNDFSDSEKKTVNNKFIVNSQEQKKHLKIALPYSSEMIRSSTERSTKTTTKSEIETNFTTTIKVGNVEKVFTTKVTNAPSSVLKTKNLVENLEPATTAPEIRTFTFPEFIGKENLDVPNALFETQEPNTPTSLPLIPTENEIKKFITEQTVTVNKSSSNFLFTSSKSQTTEVELVISKFPIEDSSKENTKKTEIENSKNIEMETTSLEERLTELTFTQFTDRPLTTDLLTTNKKDQETVGKNSRKMHFSEEFLKTTAPDQISQPKNLEHRRSDILIDDLDDRLLEESVFSSNYMKQLKENNNLNSSSDFIIQLIPFVISDLRENKISSEDLPILSKAFGAYWPTVLTLTNSTNLDMLPLLKMKNEKDLSKILSTFFPEKSENSHSIATELKESDRDEFLAAYYYEGDYSDLSKEQREYWKNEDILKRDLENLRYSKNVKMEQME